MAMILYNIRYRGPYEYDKFILNTFQLYNETRRIEKKLDQTVLTEIKQKAKMLNDQLDALTGENCILQTILGYKERTAYL